MKKTLFAAIAAAIMLGCPASSAAPQETLWGVVTHMLNTSRFYTAYPTDYWNVQKTLPPIQQLGTTWVRDSVYALTSPEHPFVSLPTASSALLAQIAANRATLSSYFDLYDAQGINVVLAILALQPTVTNAVALNADFTTMVVKLVQAHPSIRVIELHNEPNLTQFWTGTPQQYIDTYRPIAQAIKAARSDIQVVGGSNSSLFWNKSFFGAMLEEGLLTFVDGISVHPYNDRSPPETDPLYSQMYPATAGPNNYELAINEFWRRVQLYNTTKKPLTLYFTELGYASAPNGGLAGVGSEAKQAAYLSRLVMQYEDLRLRGLPLQAAFWYDFKDDGVSSLNEQYNYGLMSFDLTREKPAFIAYQTIVHAFPKLSDLSAIDTMQVVASTNPTALKYKTWQRAGSNTLVVPFWRLDQVVTVPNDFDTTLEITLPDLSAVSDVLVQNACTGAVNHAFFSQATNLVSVLSVNVTASMCASWLAIVR